tara:strand:+ start:943 stop:1173 length:231 start_codon:yes stop_codon:yes gene_type:complete
MSKINIATVVSTEFMHELQVRGIAFLANYGGMKDELAFVTQETPVPSEDPSAQQTTIPANSFYTRYDGQYSILPPE